ncbi:DUF4124 domain-containing protein [Diaphorobacter sp.]|uniref:DUF4124 domain-containing protein n=1 Tax=Diaphorobacter sp. TaxID=1934310 RepID=UPI003D108A40
MRIIRAILCLAMCSFAASAAFAQIHRCKDAAGKTIYSDAPCATGQTGQLIARQKSQDELQQERAQAAEANERKYQAQQAQREQQSLELQQRNAAQAAAAAAPPRPLSASRECREAQKDLEFVSSIRTTPQDEKRMRTNAAIARVNASCGSNMPLMQEPPKVVDKPQVQRAITHCSGGFCYDDAGQAYHRNGPDFLTGPNGRTCHRSGSFWNCN